MKRTVVWMSFSLALALLSCQSQSPSMQARVRYPQLEVNGSVDQLSKEDIFEIVQVVSQHPKMLKPIHRIHIEAPDRAEVSGGGYLSNSSTVVKVEKQNGRWAIIKGSFYYPRVITTS
jgi:hypothetical protein